MKIFAIDTSSAVLAIGLAEEDQLIGELVQNKALTHSERLMPHIAYLLEAIDEKISDMDYFAVTVGPGSFTGIRIGVATANAFALAQGKKVIELSTLEALAFNVRRENLVIIPTMYAQRDDYYRAAYVFEPSEDPEDSQLLIKRLKEEEALSREEILAEALDYAEEREVLFLGEMCKEVKKEIEQINKNRSKKLIQIADYDDNYIRPSTLCKLASLNIHRATDLAQPVYIRKPQAEVQYEEKQRLLEE